MAEICIRLDGIPLAIELAAARVSALSPDALMRRLNHSLEMLIFGAADLPERQQTLRTTIAWSYNLLDREMQTLFAALSVFKGGGDIETAEAVIGEFTQIKTLDGIEHLLEKSLLVKRYTPDNELRFHMLETINEYAAEVLESMDFADRVRERYAGYYYRMVREGAEGVLSPDQKKWLERLGTDYENISCLLAWYVETGRMNQAAEMAINLRSYWESCGRFSAGVDWYQRILNTEISDEQLEQSVQIGLGAMYLGRGNYRNALAVLENSYDSENLLSTYYLAWACFRTGALDRAEDLFDQSIALEESGKTRYGII